MDPFMGAMMMGGGSLLQGLGGFIGAQGQGRANQAAGQMGWLGSVLAAQAAEQGYKRANEALSPYSNAGKDALGMLMKYISGDAALQDKIGGGGANLLSTFDPTMEQLEKTPGYQWARDQALGSMTNAAAAKGLGTSGNLLQGLGTTATGLASQTFQQQLQNYMAQNQEAFNKLYGPASLGSAAAGGIANAATTAAGNIGGAAMGAGSALGGGIMGQANALAGGVNALAGGAGNALTYGGYFGSGFNNPSQRSSSPSSIYENPIFARLGSAAMGR